MRLLLDTHVWVWTQLDPSRLSRRCRSVLQKSDDIHLSPVSLWELLLLVEKGRVRVGTPASEWIRRALEAAPMKDAPFTREVAIASRSVVVAHGDPADRFLAATAEVHDLVLVTADENLLAGKGFRTLKAD